MSPTRQAPLARVEALMGQRPGVGRERVRVAGRRTTQARTRQRTVGNTVGSLPPEAIAARVQAHVAWREQAQQLVETLGRTTPRLTGDTRTQHVAAVAKLSQAIVRSYLDSAVLQGRQGQWEDALSSAQQAVERVQALATLEGVSPQAIEPLTVKSYLQRGYARFMRDGNSPQLREELVEAQARFPRSPSLAKWTAHYQVMAGHLAEARRTLHSVLDFTKIQPQFTALRALTHPLDTRATEQAYPCNFYAYRYELVGDAILEAMGVQANLIRTWDPANNSAPLEELQRLIDEAAQAAGQQAREAALASVAAQDQDTVADDLEKEAASDSRMFTERQLHQNINHLPKRNLTANPAAAAEQRKRNADEAARKAAEAAKTQTIDALQALKKQVPLAGRVLEALTAWNAGSRAFRHQNYVGATLYFRDTRVAILQYFSVRYPGNKYPVPNTEAGVYSTLCQVARDILANKVARPAGAANKLVDHWKKRLASNTLEGSSRENLTRIDWFLPTLPFALKVGKTENPFADAVDLLTLLGDAIGKALECQKVEEKVDAPLLTLALVHVSLGIAEARRFNRDFDGSLSECRQLEARHADFQLLSQTIEVPFVALMKAYTLLEKGDAEYKSRMLAPDTNTTLWEQYQGLIAADTYLGVFVVLP